MSSIILWLSCAHAFDTIDLEVGTFVPLDHDHMAIAENRSYATSFVYPWGPPSRSLAQAVVRAFPDLKGVYVRKFFSESLFYGFAELAYDHQGGCRGDKKIFAINELLGLTHFSCFRTDLSFHAVLSLEPGTIGESGYPLLFATYQRSDGELALIDRYPARNFFTELACELTVSLYDDSFFFLYAGVPGNPALGPLPDQRIAAFYILEGALARPWLVTTDTSFGVVTVGYDWGDYLIEVSGFNGTELEKPTWGWREPRIDSASFRFTYAPINALLAQFSIGRLRHHIQHNALTRLTASISYTQESEYFYTQSMFAWGLDKPCDRKARMSFLLESCFNIQNKHVLFGRFEHTQANELTMKREMGLKKNANDLFSVNKVGFGYLYQFNRTYHVEWSAGISLNVDFPPASLEHVYGRQPFSYFLFLKAELV